MNLRKIEKILSNVLFLGVIFSSLLIVFAIFFGNSNIEDVHSYKYNFGDILDGLTRLDAATYYMLGIFILILTPIIRIVAMLVQFLILKDNKYVVISFIVIFVLSVSLVFGVTH